MADEDDKKDVAMERPHNILNSASDANRRTDTYIKGLVFWWSGLTLFYLGSDLNIIDKKKKGDAGKNKCENECDESGLELFGIHFEGFNEQTFLIGLLFLNVVFWVRLIWRIGISCKYNKIYYDSVREDVNAGHCAEKFIQNTYEKNMGGFNKIEKWLFGLGVPLVLGFVAIVCLSCCLIFDCLLWLKMCFYIEFSTFIFWPVESIFFWPVALAPLFIISALVFSALVFGLVFSFIILYCEYCRETELQKFLEGEKTGTRLSSGEKKDRIKRILRRQNKSETSS